MKIIRVDNYNRDFVPDKLIASDVEKYYGKIIVDRLNKIEGETTPYFFRLVKDDYKLYKFLP
jgi:hypothetical protein